MNPLLYKAHPFLSLTVDLIDNPKAHTLAEVTHLALIYLAVNLVWTAWLWWGVRKAAGFSPSLPLAYVLALPAQVLYLPLMLTLLGDVLAHAFHFADRFIAVFSLLVASQMLGALYAVSIRDPQAGRAIGMVNGLTISLFMWLLCLPAGLGLLWLDSVAKIF